MANENCRWSVSVFLLVLEEKFVITLSAFVASWLVTFFLAAFYEGLKTFRDVLAQRGLCDACSPTRDRQPTM